MLTASLRSLDRSNHARFLLKREREKRREGVLFSKSISQYEYKCKTEQKAARVDKGPPKLATSHHYISTLTTENKIKQNASAVQVQRQQSINALMKFIPKLELRSVERGICPIATSTINKRNVPIIVAGCMAHEREGHISTSGLKSDVTIVFLDPDFL